MSLIKSIKFVGSNLNVVTDLMKQAQAHEGDLRVTIEPWSERRSLSANNQIQVWYAQIAKQDGEDAGTIERQCKRMFGLPILMQMDEYKRKLGWTLDKLDFFSWPYESQCEYMELLPVTRLFHTPQHNEYRQNLLNFYNKNGYNLGYMT